jgi:dTDP-4-dehydrorhamnose reductase
MDTRFNPETATRARLSRSRLELWGGIECTVNRIGDTFVDQFESSGHHRRRSDLDRVASLGIRTLRYPVSWERITQDGSFDNADWSWIDDHMGHLHHLGIDPIVGLVHHGSGPRHTSLLDPEFPQKLAEFAAMVARRYPWVTQFTPVNEPLTTARFSGLYGHWYPHGTDEETFTRCLMTEIRATVLAMRAIREVTPGAKLIQTEDMGKTHSTPALAYQAQFENERRWVTFDLLCGHVKDDSHRMWGHFRSIGIPEETLRFFAENPCPPDVFGINHYVTSERFLDERLHHYPEHTHGSNGRHSYADVEAVRSLREGPSGVAALLRETWDRYHLPIAITEAHLGCTREEQLRWLVDVWKQAESARESGADVRAVTSWSLFGAYDWDSLLTRPRGNYESGVFDLRGTPEPRETCAGTALPGACRRKRSAVSRAGFTGMVASPRKMPDLLVGIGRGAIRRVYLPDARGRTGQQRGTAHPDHGRWGAACGRSGPPVRRTGSRLPGHRSKPAGYCVAESCRGGTGAV